MMGMMGDDAKCQATINHQHRAQSEPTDGELVDMLRQNEWSTQRIDG
jgi:hypothetical protein